MTLPTPAPVPSSADTGKADENLENPAEGGADTHFTEQQRDAQDKSPTDQRPQPINQGNPIDTDKGITGSG